MNEKEIYRQESCLLRAYGALTPTNPNHITCPPFPDTSWLNKPCHQFNLFKLLVLEFDSSFINSNNKSNSKNSNNSNDDDDHDENDVENNKMMMMKQNGKNWKFLFWKRFILTLQNKKCIHEEEEEEEEGEIDERILNYYISSLLLKNKNLKDFEDLTQIHTYFFGDLNDRSKWSRINLYENKACISNGTTGLRSWGSSACLGNYLILNQKNLLDNNNNNRRRKIIELGSGTGLLGILAFKLNNKNHILLTDFNQIVLDRLQLNINFNNVSNNYEGSLRVKYLDWNSSSCFLDQSWSINQDESILILGADIIYDPELVLPLVLTIKNLLLLHYNKKTGHEVIDKPSSLALICTIIRNFETWDLFLNTCSQERLKIEFLKVDEAIKYGNLDGNGIIFSQSLDHDNNLTSTSSNNNVNNFKLVSIQI